MIRTLIATVFLALLGSAPAMANESAAEFLRPARKVCYAQNRGGRTFSAEGWANQGGVQAAAMRACRVYSRNPGTCRPLGCRIFR